MSITPRVVGDSDAIPPLPDVEAMQTTGATFQIMMVNFMFQLLLCL